MSGERSLPDARDAMQQAQRIDETVHASTRWYGRFLLTCGCVLFVGASLMGVVPTIVESFTVGVAVSFSIAGLLLAALVLGMVYINRQPVIPYSYRHWSSILGSAAILLAVTSHGWRLPFLSLGSFWTMLLAGAVSALPFFVGAYLEFRRDDSREL